MDFQSSTVVSMHGCTCMTHIGHKLNIRCHCIHFFVQIVGEVLIAQVYRKLHLVTRAFCLSSFYPCLKLQNSSMDESNQVCFECLRWLNVTKQHFAVQLLVESGHHMQNAGEYNHYRIWVLV